MKLTRNLVLGLAFSFLAVMPVAADDSNQKTVLTFSKPVELPGHTLPAGTYIFQIADTVSDRHIVQIRSGDDKEQIGFVLAISNYRLEPTSKTVITFKEVPAGQPEPIRAWFYPGRSFGHEFVYPKKRAVELAVLTKVIVPAIAVETAQPDLKTVPIVAITPDKKEVPVASVIQTTPRPEQVMASAAPARQLPKTAGSLNDVLLVGVLSLAIAASLLFIFRVVPVQGRTL